MYSLLLKVLSLQNKLDFTAALSDLDGRKTISYQLYQSEEDIFWSYEITEPIPCTCENTT